MPDVLKWAIRTRAAITPLHDTFTCNPLLAGVENGPGPRSDMAVEDTPRGQDLVFSFENRFKVRAFPHFRATECICALCLCYCSLYYVTLFCQCH